MEPPRTELQLMVMATVIVDAPLELTGSDLEVLVRAAMLAVDVGSMETAQADSWREPDWFPGRWFLSARLAVPLSAPFPVEVRDWALDRLQWDYIEALHGLPQRVETLGADVQVVLEG